MAASNRGVAYIKPGEVEVQSIDFPKLVNPWNGKKCQARRHPQDRLHQHLRLRPAHGPRPHHRPAGPDPRPRDHRRSHRSRLGRRVHQEGRPLLRAVQHRLRPLPQLQGRQDRHLPERQPRPSRRRVRLRRHGRLGRRAGGVRHGALRRLQPAEVPRQDAGDGEDQGSHAALRHLPDRLSRRGHGRRRAGHHGVRRRRGPGRPGVRGFLPPARRGRRHRRRHDRRAPHAGEELWLRNDRPEENAPTRRRRSSRSSARCRKSIAPSTASASKPTATARTPASNARPPC